MSDPKHITDNENLNDYGTRIIRWFLISLGAWPQTSASNNKMKKLAVSMQIFIFSTALAIILIPCMLYIGFEKKDIKTKLHAIVPLFNRISGSLSYWIILTRNKDVQRCIRHMETDWKLVRRIDNRKVMLQYAKFGRWTTALSATFIHGSTYIFNMIKAMETTTVIIGNKTITIHPMTCPMYSRILDVRFSPANEIMLGVQYLSTFVMASSIATVYSLATVFAAHACGQLNVLHTWLNELAEEKTNHLAERKLGAVVKHHWRVLSFVQQIESIMHKACLSILMGCTINMCFLGYFLVMNWSAFNKAKILANFITYMSTITNLFIICYIGEILTEECEKIGDITYMTNWYKLPHKTALGLILIIMQSSHTIKITAGKLFLLSIATFGDVLKTSTAYLNILRTMTT
ncbi:odorant receptor 82a-like [Temnothorax curvispinosus]|uniref:Odorant receptor n=1 Tax=Temnothorax curvispinosus TaxID=300111 RepID=A0A6J1R6C0_9HYME|nr:odorant receptor 82a-like [Temnothorax curvispinosus]